MSFLFGSGNTLTQEWLPQLETVGDVYIIHHHIVTAHFQLLNRLGIPQVSMIT
jgi:hypothetical protein